MSGISNSNESGTVRRIAFLISRSRALQFPRFPAPSDFSRLPKTLGASKCGLHCNASRCAKRRSSAIARAGNPTNFRARTTTVSACCEFRKTAETLRKSADAADTALAKNLTSRLWAIKAVVANGGREFIFGCGNGQSRREFCVFYNGNELAIDFHNHAEIATQQRCRRRCAVFTDNFF